MARFIKTRAADQCRSHHQKMEKKFNTIDAILESATPENLLVCPQIKQLSLLNDEDLSLSS